MVSSIDDFLTAPSNAALEPYGGMITTQIYALGRKEAAQRTDVCLQLQTCFESKETYCKA